MSAIKIRKDAENLTISKNILTSIGKKIKFNMPRYQYMGLFKLKKKTFLNQKNILRRLIIEKFK